jgi:hypothetical protein
MKVIMMEDALKAVLMFHGSGPWTTDVREEWKKLTGEDEATTKVLCDVVRAALEPPDVENGIGQLAPREPNTKALALVLRALRGVQDRRDVDPTDYAFACVVAAETTLHGAVMAGLDRAWVERLRRNAIDDTRKAVDTMEAQGAFDEHKAAARAALDEAAKRKPQA